MILLFELLKTNFGRLQIKSAENTYSLLERKIKKNVRNCYLLPISNA